MQTACIPLLLAIGSPKSKEVETKYQTIYNLCTDGSLVAVCDENRNIRLIGRPMGEPVYVKPGVFTFQHCACTCVYLPALCLCVYLPHCACVFTYRGACVFTCRRAGDRTSGFLRSELRGDVESLSAVQLWLDIVAVAPPLQWFRNMEFDPTYNWSADCNEEYSGNGMVNLHKMNVESYISTQVWAVLHTISPILPLLPFPPVSPVSPVWLACRAR